MIIGYIGPDGLAYNKKWKLIVVPLSKSGPPKIKRVLEADKTLSLTQGEIILYIEEGVLGIQDNWRTHGYTPLWDGIIGAGPLFITNMRIVHYREPKPGKYIEYSGATLSLPDAIGDALSAKGAKGKGMKEYCEIPFHEIVKIEILHKGVIKTLDCLDGVFDNQRFRVHVQKRHTPFIEQTLKNRELKRETTSRGKSTAIWYVNPEEVDKKALARRRKEKKKAIKKA